MLEEIAGMIRGKDHAGDLRLVVQVTNIRPTVVPTDFAGAIGIERAVVGGIVGVAIDNGAFRGNHQAGAGVTVAMTDAGQEFVTPLTFQTLSGRRVYTSRPFLAILCSVFSSLPFFLRTLRPSTFKRFFRIPVDFTFVSS